MRIAGFFVTTLASVAANAATQAAPDGQAQGMAFEEVIVTAERMSQSAQTAPISVTVLGEQQLQEMGARSFTDYAPSVPALAFQSLAPGEQRILLRGVSDGVGIGLRGDTQNVTGVYIDDMVVSNNVTAPDLNLFDIERIEVLKGPQGTLYGDGSVGGLLRVITKKADPTRFEGSAEATYAAIAQGGSEYAVNGMVNLPVVDDKLAVRLVGQYQSNDGFIDDIERNQKDVNDLEQTGFRGSVRWVPSDTFSATLSALYQRTELGGGSDYNVVLGDLLRATIFGEPVDTKFSLYNATLDWNLGSATLTSSSSYSIYDRSTQTDFTDFLSTILAPLPSVSNQGQHSKSFAQEVRIATDAQRRLRGVAGLYYFTVDEDSFEHDVSHGLFDLFESAGMPIDGTPFDVGEDVIFTDQATQERDQVAVFGELTYSITDALSATIGGRWFDDKLTNRDAAGGLVTESEPFDLEKHTHDDGQVFRARLADQFTPDVLMYAVASQGYRIGGLNPLNPATINDPSFPPSFDPDKLYNYEIGWKTRWLDQRLTLNGAVFYIDWDNIQIQIPLPTGFSIIGNAGSAKIQGAELELSILPLDNVELGISGSYIQAELGKDLVDDSDPLNPVIIGREGDQLTGVPKEQGSAYAQWRFPLGDALDGIVRGDVQYVGTIDRFFGTDVESYGDYTLGNLRFSLQWADVTVTAFVKNIGNERARFFRGQQATSAPEGREDIYVAQPRTIGVTLSKQF